MDRGRSALEVLANPFQDLINSGAVTTVVDAEPKKEEPKKEVDVFVCAGDLGVFWGLESILQTLCKRYPQVVYVAGNHEFYQTSPKEIESLRSALSRQLSNLHWLEDSSVKIGGRTFHGATLWFPDTEESRPYRDHLNDFHLIEKFVPWVFDKHGASKSYLQHAVKPGDIVVTHHIPLLMGTDPRWWNSPLNSFFVSDVEPLLTETKPALWIYGHTHSSHDFKVGPTRLVCNPFGYARMEENPDFEWGKFLEI